MANPITMRDVIIESIERPIGAFNRAGEREGIAPVEVGSRQRRIAGSRVGQIRPEKAWPQARSGIKIAAKGKISRRGKRLKAPLLKALAAAGPSGIKVKDLAAKLKVKPGNIFSWFYTTGKKISGIKKVGEAKYAYTS